MGVRNFLTHSYATSLGLSHGEAVRMTTSLRPLLTLGDEVKKFANINPTTIPKKRVPAVGIFLHLELASGFEIESFLSILLQ